MKKARTPPSRFTGTTARERSRIGDRKGSYDGMPEKRSFHVIFVGDGHGTGVDLTAHPDRVVDYEGKSIDVKE